MPKGDGNSRASKKSKKAFGDGLPSFDAKALSELTEKIDHGLKKTTPKTKNERANTSEASKKSSSATRERSETGRGIKRDSQGNAKANHRSHGSKLSKDTKAISGSTGNDREVLLQEILALGGTEEDLDLVADADSDDEGLAGNGMNATVSDRSFHNDLAKFVAGLGIESNLVVDAGESENEAEDTWEDASAGDLDVEEEYRDSESTAEDGEEELAAPVAAPSEPVRISASSSKDQNRLVSFYL